jgi:hypothetical protein
VKRFQQMAEKRTTLQLEYTALHNKGREMVARNSLYKSEMQWYAENIAQNEDPMITGMARFWEMAYDHFREKLLDCIYNEFQVYRYEALSHENFGDLSLSRFLRSATSQQEQATDTADKIDDLYLTQNVNLLRLMHENISDLVFKSRLKRYPVYTELQGSICRFRFDKEYDKPLFHNGTGNFYIHPGTKPFHNLAHLSVAEVKVFFTGLPAGTAVQLSIYHQGAVKVKNRQNEVFEFIHEPPGPAGYGFQTIERHSREQLMNLDKYQGIYTIPGEPVDFAEHTRNSFRSESDYISINPCTGWKVQIEEASAAFKAEMVTGVVFQFRVKGILIPGR